MSIMVLLAILWMVSNPIMAVLIGRSIRLRDRRG